MGRQEKLKHKKQCHALRLLSPLRRTVLCITHPSHLPHEQKYLLSHEEQHPPSTSKTTASQITFLLDPVRGHTTHHFVPADLDCVSFNAQAPLS